MFDIFPLPIVPQEKNEHKGTKTQSVTHAPVVLSLAKGSSNSFYFAANRDGPDL